MFLIKVANFFAKYSVERWNRCRPLRRICRYGYRFLMEFPAELGLRSDTHRVGEYEFAQNDTYPYRQRRRGNVFAPWPECDEPGKYCLISDSQDLVIRRSASYVAWKYHEATGRRLQFFAGGGHINDVKNWDKVMELNFKYPIEGNFAEFLQESANHRTDYYIGVNPKEGEFGQAYWYEGILPEGDDSTVCASTYYGFHYAFVKILPSEEAFITWYRVC